MDCPLDYSLCVQTVTQYRLYNNAVKSRQIDNCYFQISDGQSYDAFGARQETNFLLIVPDSTVDICPGDRFIAGIGPRVGANEWMAFTPENIAGLVQVAYVKPCYWENEICHYEAGSKQGGSL